MERMKWRKLQGAPDTRNYADNENHYIIQQHDKDKFGVVWLRYPNAFMNFCATPAKAKIFCNSHKTHFAGLSSLVLGKPVLTKKTSKPVLTKKTSKLVLTKKTSKPVLTKKTSKLVLTKKTSKPVLTKKRASWL